MMVRLCSLVLVALSAFGGAGCQRSIATDPVPNGGTDAGGAPSSVDGGSGAGGEAGGPPTSGVMWEPCPLYLDQPDGPEAECALIDVPLRWSEPDGPRIDIFVQRLRGAGDVRAQLWLLEGGPGGSGADFDDFMEQMHDLDPSLDLYAVDHRGVGRSARLSCPAQETPNGEWGINVSPDEAPACRDALLAEWGDDLAEFTTTAAALDLERLIERTAEPDRDVFVYGVSYGTYWAHRYLQVAPAQATGVILDSIAPPGESFLPYDVDFDQVAQDFMGLCAADALCAEKLGSDPWGRVVDLTVALEGGHCPSLTATWGLDASSLPVVLASLLMSPVARTYLPALVYRYARCSDADVAAIEELLGVFFGGSGGSDYYEELSSDALFYNVALGELWPNAADHPSQAEVDAIEAGLHVTTGLSPRVTAVQDIWPAYPDDAYVDEWADTALPVLMMNGDLDPQTPIWVAAPAGEHLDGEHQQFVTVPRSAHCAIVSTPVAKPGDEPCGLSLLRSFLGDPTAPVDTSCIADIPAESFTGTPANNLFVFGTADLWENDAPAAQPAPAPPGLARELSRSRRWLRAHGVVLSRAPITKP